MPKCKYYKPYMDTLKLMCEQFYELKDCGAGGPLHILLDDNNYDIKSVHFCIRYCMEQLNNPTHFNPHASTVGLMICNEYAKMSLEERAIFDSYWCGYSLDCCGDCEKCWLLDDVYDHMKEAEEQFTFVWSNDGGTVDCALTQADITRVVNHKFIYPTDAK